MSEWVAYVPLRDSLEDFEKEFNVSLPSDLKVIIQNYNKGCPKKNKIPLGDGKYIEISNLISFNKKGVTNIYMFMKLFENTNIIPFAITEGNRFICIANNKIVLYKTDTGIVKEICSSVTELLGMLE